MTQTHKIKQEDFEESDGPKNENAEATKPNEQTLQTAKDTSESVEKKHPKKQGLTLNLQNFDIANALKQH